MRGDEDSERRALLLFYPAGPFFALSAISAALLPWLWVLPLADPQQAHVRLGIFGFGGIAVFGYLLTAQRAWTGHDAPLPALALTALVAATRTVALFRPEAIWLVSILLTLVALAILLPVLRARRWGRMPLALVPFTLISTEMAFTREQIPAVLLPTAMAVLILAVGSRMVPAFLAEERQRCGLQDYGTASIWPVLALAGLGFALSSMAGLLALALTSLWVLRQAGKGIGASPANRMLCLGYSMLAPGMLGILAARLGWVPQMVQVHLLTMGSMGSMIAVVAGRVSMRRIEHIGLKPLTRHWIALWLILAATGLRCLAEFSPMREGLTMAAGIAWSAAWILFLSAHFAALWRPAPFPLLSARRG